MFAGSGDRARVGGGWPDLVVGGRAAALSGGGERSDAVERVEVVAVPRPAGREVQRPSAGVMGQAAGDREQPAAQRAGGAGRGVGQPEQPAGPPSTSPPTTRRLTRGSRHTKWSSGGHPRSELEAPRQPPGLTGTDEATNNTAEFRRSSARGHHARARDSPAAAFAFDTLTFLLSAALLASQRPHTHDGARGLLEYAERLRRPAAASWRGLETHGQTLDIGTRADSRWPPPTHTPLRRSPSR